MMTDFLSPSDAGGGELPPPLSLDPTAASLPAAVEADAIEPGPVVLLVAAAHCAAWAADAAIALATAWAQAGRRIVLADLHLEHPLLHERLGETNRDGVVDIFLYGASLTRSARPVPGRDFYLIPCGTYAADSGAVFRHPRWPKLLAGFRDARASLLLFAPADAPDLAALAQWSTEAIVLGEAGNGTGGRAQLPATLPVRAALAPPPDLAPPRSDEEDRSLEPAVPAEVPPQETDLGAPAEIGIVSETSAAEEESGAAIESEADADLPPTVELAEPAAVATLRESGESGSEPLAPPPAAVEELPAHRVRRGRSFLLWLALATLAVVVAVYLTALFRPDLLTVAPRADAGVRTTALGGAGEEAQPAPPPATPAGTLLPYAVRVKAFRSLGAARNEVAAEERRLGDQPVYVSPELIQGILYYRVLAGFPADSAAALRLRQRLLEAGTIDAEDATGSLDLIHHAPLAFRLGEYPTRQASLGRADSLAELGIPSYPAAVPYSDGGERWRLYGGAFRDSIHAEGMRQLLSQAGLQAPLVERLGKPTNGEP